MVGLLADLWSRFISYILLFWFVSFPYPMACLLLVLCYSRINQYWPRLLWHADWEAVADCAPDELLSPRKLPKISELTQEDNQVKGLKRRGRGTFLYGKDTLYSELKSDDSDDEEHKAESPSPAGDTKITDCMPSLLCFKIDILCHLHT